MLDSQSDDGASLAQPGVGESGANERVAVLVGGGFGLAASVPGTVEFMAVLMPLLRGTQVFLWFPANSRRLTKRARTPLDKASTQAPNGRFS